MTSAHSIIAVSLVLVCGCSHTSDSVTLSVPNTQAEAGLASEAFEWKFVLSTIDAARGYYSVHHTWGNPASGRQDDIMESALAEAVKDVRSLKKRGLLAPCEAALLILDIKQETWTRYHRTRNVIESEGTRSAGEAHYDGIFYPADFDAWCSLRQRLPHLRELARMRNCDPAVIETVLGTAQDNVEILRDSERPNDRKLAQSTAVLIKTIRATVTATPG